MGHSYYGVLSYWTMNSKVDMIALEICSHNQREEKNEKNQSCGQKWCDRAFHHGINGSRKYNGNICFPIYKVSKSHTVHIFISS